MSLKHFFLFLILTTVWSCTSNSEDDPLPQPETPTSISSGVTVIQDEFQGRFIVVAGSASQNLIVSFIRELDGTLLDFEPSARALPIVMQDREGNQWDVFGNAVDGPRKGQRLKVVNAGMGYWFAFSSMYPEAEIYQGASASPVAVVDADDPDWLVPTSYVAQASSLDAIPAIDRPKYLEANNRNSLEGDLYVRDDELVIGIEVAGTRIAFPHKILDVHEIINDEIGGLPLSITYCPFTGTAKIWNRELNGEILNFGVSGLLYNNNLMPFDRATESFWTQLDAWCVFGPRKGQRLRQLRYVETTWKSWLNMNEGTTTLLSDDTGISRNYDEFPYGNYRESGLVTYPGSTVDERLHPKERVHAVVVEGRAKVYRFAAF